MKIFGQPQDYSEILQRVFYTSVATGIVCTIVLADASPSFQALINSIPNEADIGPLKKMKVLYVLIPVAVAVLSRMLKLHDRVSDILRIRHLFDTRCILFPLAKGAGLGLNKVLRGKIRRNRVSSMYAVFYPFAGFKKPLIDEQLVRTAADNWGWFWVLVESSFLIGVTAGILLYLRKWNYVHWCAIALSAECLLVITFWFACRRGAIRQVAAILADSTRKKAIVKHFRSL